MSVELSFDVLEKAFPKMTEGEREIITSVHPLLDGTSFREGANLLSMSESKFINLLNGIFGRFPELEKEVLGKRRERRKNSIKENWSDRDMVMEEFAGIFGLEPLEYEFLKLIHPIFDVGMTREQACENLGWSRPTGFCIWKSLLKRFPKLEESMKKWTNPEEVSQQSLKNPMRFGNFDDPYFGEDRIVRKF